MHSPPSMKLPNIYVSSRLTYSHFHLYLWFGFPYNGIAYGDAVYYYESEAKSARTGGILVTSFATKYLF